MKKYHEFKIQQLRMKNIMVTLNSILGFVAALFISALLPALLAKYYYSPDKLMVEQPKLLEFIPVISFAASVLYFLVAIIGNILRENKVKKYQYELESMDYEDSCCKDCNCVNEKTDDQFSDVSEDELKELEGIVDEALKTSEEKNINKTKKSKKNKSTKKLK